LIEIKKRIVLPKELEEKRRKAMVIQTRRREDLVSIARNEMELRLKGIVTVYARLFPVPLKGINIRFENGVTVEYVPLEHKL